MDWKPGGSLDLSLQRLLYMYVCAGSRGLGDCIYCLSVLCVGENNACYELSVGEEGPMGVQREEGAVRQPPLALFR